MYINKLGISLIGLEGSSYSEFSSPSFWLLVLTKCWSVSVNLKYIFITQVLVLLVFFNFFRIATFVPDISAMDNPEAAMKAV